MSKKKIDKKKIVAIKREAEKIRSEFRGIPKCKENRGLLEYLEHIECIISWILQILDLFDGSDDE